MAATNMMNNETKKAIGPELPARDDASLRDEPLPFLVASALPVACSPPLDAVRFRVLMASNLPAAFDYGAAGERHTVHRMRPPLHRRYGAGNTSLCIYEKGRSTIPVPRPFCVRVLRSTRYAHLAMYFLQALKAL